MSKTWTLLDSGSCVSIIPRKPEDKIDSNFRLRSVNGSSIPTFGSQMVEIRIGRKTYEIEAVKVDIQQKILGWDFFKKYSLGFEWGDFGDLFLTDKKSKIKSLLKCFKLPSRDVESVQFEETYEEPSFQKPSNAQILYETECMKNVDSPVSADIGALAIDPDYQGPLCDNLPLSTNADPDADLGEKQNLEALQKLDPKYKNLVSQFPNILKSTFKKEPVKGIYHRIETEGPPFKSKVRPLLADSEKSEEGKKIWDEMVQLGVVERVKPNTLLQYTSPLHMVRKPNGRGWRICADFRKLNQITKSDNYPLPLLRSFQSKIKGSTIFSKLDIKNAFHHLPIDPRDIDKTCVLSPWGGAYVFKPLAFGLTNGPASWQKYLDSVIADIPGIFCYLDDLLICSANVDQHLSTLKTLFERLSAHDLTLALDKCEFGQPTMDYLGYQVSTTGIRPLKRKVDAIEKIPKPTTQKALMQYLGALNYFRSSLSGLVKSGKYHNAANLLQPLYSVATTPIPAKKFEEVWENSPVLQGAFEDSKKLLTRAAELCHPDPQLPLALMCDASDHSVGSVLLQQSKSGKWFPLGYMSRHLSIDKSRWSTCRKELLAAQAGLRYFISEIYGRHCVIYSDHAPLVLAFKNPQGFQLHDPVAQRALMEIGQFTKDIRHIEGIKNTGSDYLSRIPPDVRGAEYQNSTDQSKKPVIAALEGHKLHSMSPAVIFEAQESCQETALLRSGRHATSLAFQNVEFGEVELFCEISQSKPRPFLPKQLRKHAIEQLHGLAHTGIKETIRNIASHYYWTDMRAEITRYVQTCHGCQSVNPSKFKPPHLGKFEVPDQRFTHIHVDIVGPLPESEGYKFLLTIIDRTTRLLFALPVKDTSAQTCSQQFLLHYVSLFGIPSACTSDQGANFVSNLFKEVQRNLGIDVKYTPIYWPQGNGLIERNHQSLKNSIKAQLIELGNDYQNKWYHYLPWALLGRRTAFNKDLGTSSSELALGTHVQVPGSILQDVSFDTEPNIADIIRKLEYKNNRVAVPTSSPKIDTNDEPDANITHVYAKQHAARGLQPPYQGPFKVNSRPGRSSLTIRVGRNMDDSDRLELRSWADCKPANRRQGTEEAQRPKRGRPPKNPEVEAGLDTTVDSSLSPPVSSDSDASLGGNADDNKSPNLSNSNEGGNSSRSTRSTRNPAPNYVDALVASIDFSRPPPSYPPPTTWTASRQELEVINRSIRGY